MQLYPEASLFARHGYGVLLYDSRTNGESDGDLLTWGEREQRDVEAALDYVAARADVDPDRVALLGFSIGASAVALAAASDPRARAVILYATWSSLEEEIRDKHKKYGVLSWGPSLLALRRDGVDVDDVRPIDRIAAIHPRPLLMIAGTRDEDTPLPVMQRLFAAAREPKELWIVEGGKHGGFMTLVPAEYESRVIGFLERALPAGAVTP
jgi:dipeptidyl aminopeptidase/acylaminoacyl peptidase